MNPHLKAILIIAVPVFFLIFAIWGLGDARFPLMISFGLAYLVFPLIRKLEAKGANRQVTVFGVFALLLAVITLLLVLIVPRVISDANDFIQELPQSISRALEKVEGVALQFGYELDLSREEIKSYIVEHSSEFSGGLLKGISKGVFSAFSGITTWLISLLGFFLIPLFFFYLINDYEKLLRETKALFPQFIRPKLRHYLDLSDRVLSGYIRGQLIVALVLAGLYAVGLSVIGLKFGILIGMISGLLNVIPYVGFSVGFASALLVAVANDGGSGMFLGILLVFGIVQGLEGTIITPKLVGDKVGLSPLLAILALIIGGNVAGLAGMLIAIPIAAIAKRMLSELKQEYFKLEIYKT
jgi:predicted PurR-regulated permease PerM